MSATALPQFSREEFARMQNEETDFSKFDDFAALEAKEQIENRVGSNSRFAHDAKLYVVFYSKPMRNENKTREANRPMFDNVDFVRVMVPGDKHNVVNREASDEDKIRFGQQYQAYLKSSSQEVGTPLAQVAFLTADKIEELKFFHITTVEALAGVPDALCQKFMGLQDYKQKAIAFLSQGTLEAQSAQTKQIADLQAQVAALIAAQSKQAPVETDGAPQLPRSNTLHAKK